jgi:primosomal replication protein N
LEQLNSVTLIASIISLSALRYTPAGIPVVELGLLAESEQTEAGRKRQVALDIMALAAGEAAEVLSKAQLGARLRMQGFLAHKGKSRITLQLHINTFEFI